MITNIKKENCCGCSACAYSCPLGAISMLPDAEGFIRPHIEEAKCIGCNTCENVCPASEKAGGGGYFDPAKAHIIGLRIKGDQTIIKRSASGGAFYALAKQTIMCGGHVFGAAFDENLVVRHIEVTEINAISRIQNSKYVQSDLGDTFPRIKELLACTDIPVVLFSGTPCQCAGLKCYLGNNVPEKLILVDLVCHGVPSPLLFQKYLSWKEKRMKEKITRFAFRTKAKGGWNFNGRMSAFMQANQKIYPNVLDPYMCNFLSATNYAEACYRCEFATRRKAADITLGDFTGIREKYPDFFSKDGCSIVLTPTEKGRRYFEHILNDCHTIDVDFSQIKPYSRCLVKPCERPPVRDTIYEGIREMDGDTYISKRLLPKNKVRRIISFYFPYKVKKKIKRIFWGNGNKSE